MEGALQKKLCITLSKLYIFLSPSKIFKTDDKNGLDVQSQVDALLERQRQDNIPSAPKTPSSR